MMRILFSAAVLILIASSSSFAEEQKPLSLSDLISLAVERNRDIAKAKEYDRYVKGRYVEERAAALPQLSLNGAFSASKDESARAAAGVSPRQRYESAEISLSQPLFTWGKIGAAIRGAEVGLKTADEQLRIYRQAAVRDVSTLYYDIALSKELIRLANENVMQKERHLDEAKKKYAAGIATDYDVLAAEVSVANARPDVVSAENRLKNLREELRFMLALDYLPDVQGDLSIDKNLSLPKFDEAYSIALNRRPELADLKYRVKIYRELVTIASAENKPRIDFKGSGGYRSLSLDPSAFGSADGFAWNAGVYLSFPFFDGFRTSGKVFQAESDLKSREIEESKLKDSIRLEIRSALNSIKEADEILKSAASTVRQAEKLLSMAEKGFELGVKTRLDVDDAQLNLLQAQTVQARAEHDYHTADIRFRHALGVIGEQ